MAKGTDTRERILGRALRLASRDGLDGLTIGSLAGALQMSKSGLFGHFRSKEQLQIDVLEAASRRFVQEVLVPAFREPRGEPRVRAAFDRWLHWVEDALPGGCLFVHAASELDDRPGPVRDHLVHTQEQLLETVARSAALAVREGHFRKNLDTRQFAFELHALVLAHQYHRRLIRDARARERTRAAFDRLLDWARPH